MKHLVKCLAAILAWLLFSLASVHAEAPPVCTGTDLLAQLEAEHPEDYAAVMAEAGAVPNGEAVFWMIERDGLAPSWLLGTAHVTDPRVTNLTPVMNDALSGADVIALELKELRNQQEFMAAALANAELMVLPPGQSLWDLIPDDQEPLIRDNPNLPPGAAKAIFGYQPWVVAAMVTVPLCETARKQAGIAALDAGLAARAQRQHVPLEGLETVEEQLSVFANMPLEQQARYLTAAAALGPKAADYFETLVSLYEQRRVTAYMPLMMRLEPLDSDGEAMLAFVEEDLIARRNQTMMKRARRLLENGNAFIAVGALHLPGNDGLVELIRKAGYNVTPVN